MQSKVSPAILGRYFPYSRNPHLKGVNMKVSRLIGMSVLSLVLAMSSAMVLTGCGEEQQAEVEAKANEAKDKVEAAADKAKDSLDAAAKEAEEKAKEAQKEIENAM